jgi:hypothetical protein
VGRTAAAAGATSTAAAPVSAPATSATGISAATGDGKLAGDRREYSLHLATHAGHNADSHDRDQGKDHPIFNQRLAFLTAKGTLMSKDIIVDHVKFYIVALKFIYLNQIEL